MKRPLLRQAAEQDIENGFDRYLKEANAAVAAEFLNAIETALTRIKNHAGIGSPRYGELLGTPNLRSWLLKRFPYILFYVEHDDYLDVIRLLHQQADIPAQLQNGMGDSGD